MVETSAVVFQHREPPQLEFDSQTFSDARIILTLAWETAQKHDIDVLNAIQHKDVTSRVPQSAREVWVDLWMHLLANPDLVMQPLAHNQFEKHEYFAFMAKTLNYPKQMQDASCNQTVVELDLQCSPKPQCRPSDTSSAESEEQAMSSREHLLQPCLSEVMLQEQVMISQDRATSSCFSEEYPGKHFENEKAGAKENIHDINQANNEDSILDCSSAAANASEHSAKDLADTEVSIQESEAMALPSSDEHQLSEPVVCLSPVPSRSGSKQTNKRSMPLPLDGLPSQDIWDKYLKHFNIHDLNWLFEAFDASNPVEGYVPLESAMNVAGVLISDTFHCQEEWVMTGKHEASTLNFEAFVAFVAAAQEKMLRHDPQAGYSYQEALQLRATFRAFAKGPENFLRTQELFEVLQDIDQHPKTTEAAQCIRRIIEEVDVDGNGVIDLQEFFHFMRKVDQAKDVRERWHEHLLISGSRFSSDEILQFQMLFNKSNDNEHGRVSFRHLVDMLVDGFNIEMTSDLKKELAQHLTGVMGAHPKEFGSAESSLNDISFGEFVALFRILLDMNFAHIATQVKRSHLVNEMSTLPISAQVKVPNEMSVEEDPEAQVRGGQHVPNEISAEEKDHGSQVAPEECSDWFSDWTKEEAKQEDRDSCELSGSVNSVVYRRSVDSREDTASSKNVQSKNFRSVKSRHSI